MGVIALLGKFAADRKNPGTGWGIRLGKDRHNNLNMVTLLLQSGTHERCKSHAFSLHFFTGYVAIRHLWGAWAMPLVTLNVSVVRPTKPKTHGSEYYSQAAFKSQRHQIVLRINVVY